jgi:uncharacterized protein YggE
MIFTRHKILFTSIAVIAILTTALAGTVAFAGPATSLPADAAQRTVAVSGSAQVTLKPDIAYVTFGTLTYDASANAARDANNTLMGKVIAALKAQGVDTDKDVKTVNYSINPRYDANGTQITG